MLGVSICPGTFGWGCGVGALIVAKGVDNLQAGIRGADSVSQQVSVDVTGSKKSGTLINFGLDLGASVYGLARSIPKVSQYGTPYNAAWYKGVPGYNEPAIKQTGNLLLTAELFSSGTGIFSVVEA
ncbi:hypothetical protein [Microbulbifer aestuariivivens]|uniref:hypothetical protein n=1 Tax=Microbulbifer aestuariivivens TaxID=1908308 RepID=UPI0031E6E009